MGAKEAVGAKEAGEEAGGRQVGEIERGVHRALPQVEDWQQRH